jgi:hypothetical protein
MQSRFEKHKQLFDMLLRDLTPSTPQKRCVCCEQLFHGGAELCLPCIRVKNEAIYLDALLDEVEPDGTRYDN